MNKFKELLEAKLRTSDARNIIKNLYAEQDKPYPRGFNSTPNLFEYTSNGGYDLRFKPIGTAPDAGVNIDSEALKNRFNIKVSDLGKALKKLGVVRTDFKVYLQQEQ